MLKYFFALPFLASSVWAATIIPFERDVARITEYYYITANNLDSKHFQSHYGADYERNLYYRGFAIMNQGPNDIVPTMPEGLNHPSREFTFLNNDRARRDAFIWLTDYNGSGYVSDYGETILVFLPRHNQFHVEEREETLEVTLTTGEEVTFFKKYKTLDGGVLSEKPVDLNPIRADRKFAQIDYSGNGIMIRNDGWGKDPRLTKNSIVLKKGLKPCTVPSSVFWTQEGYPKFKFVSDEDAYAVIAQKCGAEYLPEI